MWLDECMMKTDRHLVDDSILNFSTLIDSVRFNTFDICLPPTFIATTSKEDKSAKGKKNKGGADNISDKNESKKARSRVENTSQPEQFKL